MGLRATRNVHGAQPHRLLAAHPGGVVGVEAHLPQHLTQEMDCELHVLASVEDPGTETEASLTPTEVDAPGVEPRADHRRLLVAHLDRDVAAALLRVSG